MRCPCPKCDTNIEMSAQEISASGSQNCPECKQKYWTQREEFMLRAYKKQGKIYCIGCGHELGCEMICMQCGNLCPDYCIVQSSKPVVRKQKKAGSSFSLGRRAKPAVWKSPGKVTSESTTAPEQSADQEANKKGLTYVAIAVLALVLIGGMTKVYLDNKADQLYSKNFIVALYGVKAGTDLSLKSITDISSGWQQTVEATNIAPRLSQKDLDKSQRAKVNISTAISGLSESSEKFVKAKKNLIRLYKVYEKIYALSISAPGSLDTFTASTSKLEADFSKTAGELKSTMPEVLREKLQDSLDKYPNLKFML